MEKAANKTKEYINKVWAYVMKNKKATILSSLVVIAVVIGLAFFLNRPSSGERKYEFQTITLEKMDLKQLSSATGVTQSENSHNVNTELPYEITKVYVKEGDIVKKGDTLAQLNTDELDKKIAEARTNIKNAKQADALSLAQAQRKLSEANTTRTSNYDKNDKLVQEAYTTLQNAQSRLSSIQTILNPYSSEVSTKRTQWESAKIMYGLMDTDGPSLTSTDNGYFEWSAYRTAIQNYDSAAQLNGLSDAQATVNSANKNHDTAIQTRDTTYRNDTISINNAKDNVDSLTNKDSAANYQTQLDSYLIDRANCTLTSPISGTVTSMNAKVGNKTTMSNATSAMFVVEDANNLEVSIVVPEYDAVVIKEGMEVEISSDALSNMSWTGIVKSISAKATDLNSNFTITIKVNSATENLLIGMSAKVNIITESKKDVFAVPYDAITTNESGQQIVFAIYEGNPVAIQITTGMETDYYVEIIAKELMNGMVIMADPEGKNVGINSSTNDAFPRGF